MYKSNQEPDIPAALGLLSHLNNDELKELLNDDSKFEDIVKDIKQFKDLETEKEMLMASNRSLAEFNLSKQPELEDGKRMLKELSEKGTQLCTSIKEKLEEMKEKSGTMSVDTALDLLQAAAAEIEEESEKVAEKFLASDIEVDEFLEQFLTRRKLMHLRKVKVDKIREIMRKPHLSSGPGYPTSNFPGITPSIPYPTGPVSMPMPAPSGDESCTANCLCHGTSKTFIAGSSRQGHQYISPSLCVNGCLSPRRLVCGTTFISYSKRITLYLRPRVGLCLRHEFELSLLADRNISFKVTEPNKYGTRRRNYF